MTIDLLIKKHSVVASNKIRGITEPLRQLGIHTFCYFYVDEEGNYGTLCNQPEATLYYHTEGFYLLNPFINAPSSLMGDGMVVATEVENPSYAKVVKVMEQKYNGKNQFTILSHRGSAIEGFFFADSIEKTPPSHYYNLQESLNKYCRFFKREAGDLIGRALADRFNLKEVKGDAFFKKDENLSLNKYHLEKQKFNKEILPLSRQQSRCLALLQEGKIAKEIAVEMNLSVRTVEHYLSIIKNKLGCHSQRELLEI